MTDFFIALQSPTVKLPVTSRKSVAGVTKTLGVEFLLHSQTEGDKRKTHFDEVLYADFDLDNWKKSLGRKPTKEEIQKAQEAFAQESSDKLKALIKQEIVGLYDIPIEVKKAGGYESVIIPSVAEVKAEFLVDVESEGAALAFLLDAFLDSNPWSSALTQKLIEVWQNLGPITDEQETKNF